MTELAEAVGVYRPEPPKHAFLADIVGILNLASVPVLCILTL